MAETIENRAMEYLPLKNLLGITLFCILVLPVAELVLKAIELWGDR